MHHTATLCNQTRMIQSSVYTQMSAIVVWLKPYYEVYNMISYIIQNWQAPCGWYPRLAMYVYVTTTILRLVLYSIMRT